MINITKSQPPPDCLEIEKKKKNGDYKCGEVVKRTRDDFHNKCYLCEEKGISTINVEHFLPHKGNLDLKFDWNNLFFACPHCNSTKGHLFDDILNCTHPSPKIVDVIRFECKSFPKEKPKIVALESGTKVIRTVELLNRIYNGTTNLKEKESINLTDKVVKEIKEFNDLLHQYYYDSDGNTQEENEDIVRKIRKKLSPQSPFTAFKIWIIKSNSDLLKDFGHLIS